MLLRETKWYPITHGPLEIYQGIYISFATDTCTEQFHSFQKTATHKNQKNMDFILNCIQKMTDTARRENERDNED